MSESPAPLPHPEEMKGSIALRIGRQTVVECSGRTTPAGLISAGIALAAIIAAFGYVARAARPAQR